MILNDLYRLGVKALVNAKKSDAEFDARCLLEFAFNINTTEFLLQRLNNIDEAQKEKYLNLIDKRAKGEPLQYLLGKWEFYGNEFYVGKGVLIPRPETEMLIDLASDFLKNKNQPIIVDFCSGSGCVAVSVAKLFPYAEVYAVEKFDNAFSYLEKNILLNKVTNVKPIKGDLFDKTVLKGVIPDLILSNPPYIRTADVPLLESEVLKEPLTALDGGNDGYDFYRFLSGYWFADYLKSGSAMMLECAEDQGDCIARMFSALNAKTAVINDMNGLQRIVTAYK